MEWVKRVLQTIPPGVGRTLFSIAAGGLVVLILPPYAVPGLVWVALVPFLLLIWIEVKSEARRFFYGWLAGVVALAFTFRWALDIPPLTWLGITDVRTSFVLVITAFSLLTSFLALSFGAFLVLCRRMMCGRWWDVFTIGALWAVFEYIRVFSYSFYPFTLGTGSLLGDHLGFGLLGYAFADWEMVKQFAPLFGVYGLGFIAATSSALVVYFLRRLMLFKKQAISRSHFGRNLLFFGVTLLLGVLIITVGGRWLERLFFSAEREVLIAIAQAGSERSQGETILGLRESLAGKNPDIILLPEGEKFFLAFHQMPDEVWRILGDQKYPLIFGSTFMDSENRISVYDAESGFSSYYAKRFIVPHAEYVPYVTQQIVKLLGGEEWLRRRFNTIPGNRSPVQETRLGNIATLICMEILSPKLVRESIKDGGEILLFSSNISILRGSPAYHQEVLAMAQIWAASTRRFLAYSAHGERSFLIDPWGKIVWESPDLNYSLHVERVWLNQKKTTAVSYPYGFITAAAVYLVIVAFLGRKKLRKELYL